MGQRLLTSHIQDQGTGRSLLFSVLAHILLILLIAAGAYLLPQGALIEIGSGPGGGSGDRIIPVRLADALDSGGFGTVKPTLNPRPKAAPPPPQPKEARQETPPQPDPNTFAERKKPPKPKRPQRPEDRPPLNPPQAPQAEPGDIVRAPDPGSGGRASPGSGAGGGQGTGLGVQMGPGQGQEGGIDSAYVRLVEQRVGTNWLRTSLGELGRPVQTIVTFEVQRNGKLQNIQLVKTSGIRSVDLAARRAVRACDPLPPLPLEFRGRQVRFRAEFNYPPR
ncbi:MAG: TonB family protein [Acidobacteriota bacterium]